MAIDKTKLHDRQVEHRSNLPRLSDELKPTLKQLLPQIDAELTPVFELRESVTPDLVLNIGSGDITNSDTGLVRSFSPINQQFFKFNSGTITFPATSGNPIVVNPGIDNELIMPDDTYLAVLVQINSLGMLSVAIGTPVALEADTLLTENFPPSNKKDLSIGYLVLHNNAGAIEPIVNEKIVQFESGGGGGGGTGDANELLERLKQRLNLSTYEYMTAGIFSQIGESLTDPSTTAIYSLADDNYTFPLNADEYISTQMADPEFLSSGVELLNAEAITYWDLDAIDENATFEMSRDGGANWQPIDVNRVGVSDTIRGSITFEDEPDSLGISTPSANDVQVFDSLNSVSSEILVTSSNTIRKISANITVTGAPLGYLYAVAVKDDGGLPSTDPLDVMAQSTFIDISTLISGTVEFDIRYTTAINETYHVVIKTDDSYKSEYVNSVTANRIGIDINNTINEATLYLEGYENDLRLKIISSTGDVSLVGYGVLYNNEQRVEQVNGVIQRHVIEFDGIVDNLNEFTLPFTGDARLLTVYQLDNNTTHRYGNFVINGLQVVFPTNTFNTAGIKKLEFLQVHGGIFDNSDLNGALLTANALGSTDPQLDKSASGRGIFLRRPDGTLREIALDDNDNIIIYSV